MANYVASVLLIAQLGFSTEVCDLAQNRILVGCSISLSGAEIGRSSETMEPHIDALVGYEYAPHNDQMQADCTSALHNQLMDARVYHPGAIANYELLGACPAPPLQELEFRAE